MATTATPAPGLSYSNPVFDGYFADPAVLRTSRGDYYAYGTGHGPERDGRQFPVLHSSDFVHWTYVGGALPPLRPEGGEEFTAYWAPEVAERDGRYYLYYSAATGHRDETHRLRVAVAGRPEGPFQDLGRIPLAGEFADRFCIDGHPLRDPADGRWYLFFGTDFFTDRVGTGTAAVPLSNDMRTPAGPAVPVLRPSADWMIYERNRPLYGKVWSSPGTRSRGRSSGTTPTRQARAAITASTPAATGKPPPTASATVSPNTSSDRTSTSGTSRARPSSAASKGRSTARATIRSRSAPTAKPNSSSTTPGTPAAPPGGCSSTR